MGCSVHMLHTKQLNYQPKTGARLVEVYPSKKKKHFQSVLVARMANNYLPQFIFSPTESACNGGRLPR